jgi:hypothetical protein
MTTLIDLITWTPAASPPDSDTTVLPFGPAVSEPILLGYLNGDTRRLMDGVPAYRFTGAKFQLALFLSPTGHLHVCLFRYRSSAQPPL